MSTKFLTSSVTRGELVSTVSATGTVKAVLQVKVGSQLSGQIARLLVDFNDRVKAGQPMAELDSRSYQAKMREVASDLKVGRTQILLQKAAIAVARQRIASAEARYAEARQDFERKQVLKKKGTGSDAQLDGARATFQSAKALLGAERAQLGVEQAELKKAMAIVERYEALLSQAEIELSRTVIRAPIDGVIVGRDVEEGQTVAASLEAPTLFEIAQDLSNMEVHVRVDEADMGQVRVGQSIIFIVDAYPGREFSGAVTQIRKSPEEIDNVVAYTVVVSAENRDMLLLPGMTATVNIVVIEIHDALMVPNAALRFHPPKESNVALDGEKTAEKNNPAAGRAAVVWVPGMIGKPTPVPIQIGASDGRATELLSGPLNSGDQVIVGLEKPPKKTSFLGIRAGF